MNVAGWEAEFGEKTGGGGKVPSRSTAVIKFWKFEIERRCMVDNPAGVKNSSGMINYFSAEEASLFCEGFKLIAEFWLVGSSDKTVVDH